MSSSKHVPTILYVVFVAESKEWLGYKLGTIVVNDPPGNTKSVNDMVFDEIDHISYFNLYEQCNFRLFWEVIDYRKD